MQKNRRSDGALSDKFWHLINAKLFEDALSMWYQHAIPGNDNWTLGLAKCYQGLHLPEKALAALEGIRNKKHIGYFTCKAHLFFELENYHEAIKTFQQHPNCYSDVKTRLSIACCYEALEEYEKAYKIIQQMLPKDQNSSTEKYLQRTTGDYLPEVLLHLARHYEKKHQYDLALKTYDSIRFNKKDENHEEIHKKCLISKGMCLQFMGLYDEAMATFTEHPEHMTDTLLILARARCLIDQSRYEEGLATFTQIADWEKNKEAILGRGRCYQKMGLHGFALKEYFKIKGYKRRPLEIRLSIARCFQEIGNYQAAILELKSNPNWESSRILRIALAHCYAELNDTKQMSEQFQALDPMQKDTRLQLARAYCHHQLKNWETALAIYHRLLKNNKNKQLILSLANCYIDMQDVDLAVAVLQDKAHWKDDPDMYLCLAHCYALQNKMEEAWVIHQRLCSSFPYHQDGLYYACRFLILQQHEDALPYLKQAIKRWPYVARLSLLEINFKKQCNDKGTVDALKQLIMQFPYFRPAYFELYQYYKEANNTSALMQLRRDCRELFYGNNKFLNSIQVIDRSDQWAPPIDKTIVTGDVIDVSEAPVAAARGEQVGEVSEAKVMEVIEPPLGSMTCVLPKFIQDFFSELIKFSPHVYLTGSSLTSIIRKESIAAWQDMDFLAVLQEPLKANQIDWLQQRGYIRCPVEPQLFSLKGIRTVDVYVIVMPDIINPWKCLPPSDFTQASLFCSREGVILDPTGQGIEDTLENCLRPTRNPIELFAEDPVRCLRALKCVANKQRPTPELDDALRRMLPLEEKHRGHCFAKTRQYLRSIDPMFFVPLLHHYNLLTWFGVNPSQPLEAITKELTIKVSSRPVGAAFFQLKKEVPRTLTYAEIARRRSPKEAIVNRP